MAQRIEGLSIGLDLDALALDRGLTGVKDRLRTVNSEMRLNMSAFDRGDRSIQKYETRLDGLNKKLDVQKKATEEAYKEYQKMVQEHGEGSREAEKAERAYNNQAASLNNLERYVENATKELEEMRKEQEFQESAWGKATTNLQNFSDKTGKIGESLTDFGKTMSTRVTAPLMVAGGAAFAAADQIDKAYRELRVGTGATGEALDDLEESFDKVFKSVPDGSEQVATSMANLNTFTGATNDTLEDLTVSLLDVSRLLGEDATQNSQTFGEALQQWQRPAEEGTEILDYMFTLTQDYGIGLGELNGLLTRHGSVLNNAGFEMEEAAHFMAGLEKNGIQVSRVMPGLNQAFRNWADEGKNSREELERVVETIAETEDKQEALSLATEVFGSQGAQRLMTAIRNRAIPAFEDLGSGADDASGSIQETAEETRTIGEEFQILKNNTMQTLQPVGEILLDLARRHIPPLVDGVQNLTEWFDDLDESTQRNIIAIAGVTAAIGPASVALGGMFNVVSTLSGGLAKVTGIIGRAGGAGVAGRLGLLGATGGAPAALAIGGIAALAGGVYALSRDMNSLNEVSTETADAMMDQYQSNIPVIESFDDLRIKSRLSNDEFGRYLDLQSRLENETDPQAIEAIKDEMNELQERSGLSNEELDKMIGYNNTIVDTLPDSTSEITEQGNRIADTTENLKDYNQELANMAKRELESELQKSLANEVELRERIKEEQLELNRLEEIEVGIREIVRGHSEGTLDNVRDRLLEEQEILETAYREAVQRGEVTDELSNQMDINETLLSLSDADLDTARERLSEAIDLTDEQRDLVQEKENDLNKTGEIVAKMVEYELIAAGVSQEKAEQAVKDAEVSDLLDDQLQALKDQKQELFEQTPPALQTEDAFRRSVQEIDEQIAGLERSKGNIRDLIGEAGEYNRELSQDINKNIDLSTDPTISNLESRLSQRVRKTVDLDVAGGAAGAAIGIPTYARGTNYHPGGLALHGEEGFELARHGNRWSMLDLGISNLPRGTQVFTHDESNRIISALNSLPAYADGISYENEPTQTMRMIAAAGRRIINREQPEGNRQSGNQVSGVSNDTNITQNITINSPEPTSPAENSRRLKQAARQLAMEWR